MLRKTMWKVIAALLLLVMTGVCAFAQGIALDDRLPASHWSMDALAYLAPRAGIKGLPARVFAGDRTLSRDEVGDVILRISEAVAGNELSRQEQAWLAALDREFAPEIRRRAGPTKQKFSPVSPPDRSIVNSGYLAARFAYDDIDFGDLESSNSATTGVYRATGAYLTPVLQGFVSATNERRRYSKHFQIWDKMFLNWRNGGYRFTAGRDYLRWGPGYSGSMILGDTPPAYDQIRAQRDFSLGKILGKVNIQEFAATWRDQDEGIDGMFHDRLYLVGRRYQRELSKSWQLGVSETAKMSTSPNPLIAVLPIYLYQHIFSGSDEQINTFYSLDVKKTFGTRGEAYFDFLVDDWRAPDFLGGTDITVRKAGLLVGGAVFSKRKPLPDSFRAEAFTVDPETYEASREDFDSLAYRRDWVPIGYPLGGNIKGFALRADKWLSSRLEVIGQFKNVTPRDDIDLDYHFHLQTWDVGVNYDISTRTSLSLRYGKSTWHSSGSDGNREDRITELCLTQTL